MAKMTPKRLRGKQMMLIHLKYDPHLWIQILAAEAGTDVDDLIEDMIRGAWEERK